MNHNKYVKIGKRIKINLYVPGFPSKAFFTACKKVLTFNAPFPCVTALISITSACRYNCPHCYQRLDKGMDVDIDVLIKVINKMQDMGIAFFNIEGGDPFLRFDRLLAVCDAIDERSEILINSTGDGITPERLNILKQKRNLMGIMFSLHADTSEKLNQFTGTNVAWDNLGKGIRYCQEAGIPVAFNSCLQKEDYMNGTFDRILEIATNFKGSIIQMIKPKPSGGWLGEAIKGFTKTDIKKILKKTDHYNLSREKRNTIAVYAMIREESEHFFGCTAGAIDRFYINAKGDVQACEFLNISFGNIMIEDFERIYARMRTIFKQPSSCLLCEKYAAKVAALREKHSLNTMPLPPDVSKVLYLNWNREGKVSFYDKLSEL